MELKAKVSCKYENKPTSKAIASSIQPDNLDSPKQVDIKTEQKNTEVQTKIKVEGEIETLLSTLEDLLSCTSTAEEIIEE